MEVLLGKSTIFMGHLYHGELLNNQRVPGKLYTILTTIIVIVVVMVITTHIYTLRIQTLSAKVLDPQLMPKYSLRRYLIP